MSSHPAVQTPADPGRLPMTLPLLAEKKRLGDPIVMVTAYDYPERSRRRGRRRRPRARRRLRRDDGARLQRDGAGRARRHAVLARAVRRGLRTPLLIGDLPFGSYEVSDEQAITTAHADGQGGRLRGRQARGRRRGVRAPCARDRRRRASR